MNPLRCERDERSGISADVGHASREWSQRKNKKKANIGTDPVGTQSKPEKQN